MKKLVLIFFFLSFATLSILAQTTQYTPLHLNVGTCWFDATSATGGGQNSTLYRNHRVIGDTTINGYKYYTVEFRRTYSNSPAVDYFYKYFRNDTTNKLVYSWKSGADSVMLDFNHVVGDSIRYLTGIGFRWLVVDTAGVMMINGVNRRFFGHKTLAWDGEYNKLYIEGVGDSRGFDRAKLIPYIDTVNPNGNTLVTTKQVSCSFNKEALFGDSLVATNCWPVHTKDYYKDAQFKVYPSPFHNSLFLEIESKWQEYTIQNISIYDLQGRKLTTQNIEHTNQYFFEIDATSLVTGAYFVIIRTQSASYLKKVFKE